MTARIVRLAVIGAAVLAVAALTSGVLIATLLPALLMFAVLAAGRYPGERAVLALAGGSRKRARRPLRRLSSPGRTPFRAGPSGSALIAFNRAVRPPPRLLSSH